MSLGEIKQFACDSSGLDSNHLPCDGRALNRGTYSDLFALIGTLWGSGDGTTTFNIPLIGDFVRASTSSRAVGTSQDSQNLAHSHSATVGSNSHSHKTRGSGGVYASYVMSQSVSSKEQTTFSLDLPLDTVTHNHTCDVAQSGGSEACPKNKAVLFAIQVFLDSSSGSSGLTEEQSSQLQIVHDFIVANCKDNGDGTYDYTKFSSWVVGSGDNQRTLYLSEQLRQVLAYNYGGLV